MANLMTTLIYHHCASDPVKDIAKLIEMFPNMVKTQLKYLYDLSKLSKQHFDDTCKIK